MPYSDFSPSEAVGPRISLEARVSESLVWGGPPNICTANVFLGEAADADLGISL